MNEKNRDWEPFFPSRAISIFIKSFVGHIKLLDTYIFQCDGWTSFSSQSGLMSDSSGGFTGLGRSVLSGSGDWGESSGHTHGL